MKKLLIILVGILTSCRPDYKYEIKGKVMYNDTLRNAIWYTDTISFDGDTIYYFNSNGEQTRIYPPFIIKEK